MYISGVNPNVNNGLWVSWHVNVGSSLVTNVLYTLRGDGDNGGCYTYEGGYAWVLSH